MNNEVIIKYVNQQIQIFPICVFMDNIVYREISRLTCTVNSCNNCKYSVQFCSTTFTVKLGVSPLGPSKKIEEKKKKSHKLLESRVSAPSSRGREGHYSTRNCECDQLLELSENFERNVTADRSKRIKSLSRERLSAPRSRRV